MYLPGSLRPATGAEKTGGIADELRSKAKSRERRKRLGLSEDSTGFACRKYEKAARREKLGSPDRLVDEGVGVLPPTALDGQCVDPEATMPYEVAAAHRRATAAAVKAGTQQC